MGRTFDKEQDLQGAVAQLFAAVLAPSVLHFHVPNAAAWKRSKVIAGVLVGVPDWYLCWPNPWQGDPLAHQTGWVELKSKTGRVSKDQIAFKRRIQSLGHHWGSTGTLEGVQAYLLEWRVPMRGRLN